MHNILSQDQALQNAAIIPASKLEDDAYDWWQRHRDVLEVKKQLLPEIVLIGDSITHFWGGLPESNIVYGANAWRETFGDRDVLNLGFGWDRTQNVLWRLDNGEFDGLTPQTVVLNIGGNNFAGTKNARANTPPEVLEGIMAICDRIQTISPDSRIIVMGVFPRGQYPTDPSRSPIMELNTLLENAFKTKAEFTYLNIGERLIGPDNTISPEIMGDFCHPTEKGYSIWGKALHEIGI